MSTYTDWIQRVEQARAKTSSARQAYNLGITKEVAGRASDFERRRKQAAYNRLKPQRAAAYAAAWGKTRDKERKALLAQKAAIPMYKPFGDYWEDRRSGGNTQKRREDRKKAVAAFTADQQRYLSSLAEWKKKWDPWSKVKMKAYSEKYVDPMKMSIRGVRSPLDIKRARAALGGWVKQKASITPDVRYGKQFLSTWGRDAIGPAWAQKPALQRLMDMSDSYYRNNSLQMGSQAARDYFASNLWDYLDKTKKSTDSFGWGAITQSPNVSSYINKQLGLKANNYDSLLSGLRSSYGYVRR